MKKIIVFLLLVVFITVIPISVSFAAIDTHLEINENNISIKIESDYKKMPAALRIYNDTRNYHIAQTVTDDKGGAVFNFTLADAIDYQGKLNVAGEVKTFTFSMKPDKDPIPIERQFAYVSVKGYENKTILATVKIVITGGESVMDITENALSNNNISFDTVGGYMRSIDGLREFDYGAKSGWMFNINGDFPGISAEDITVKAGDRINWIYTVNLGKDVGDAFYKEKQPDFKQAIKQADSVISDKNASEAEIEQAVEGVIEMFINNIYNIDIDTIVPMAEDIIFLIDKASGCVNTSEGAGKMINSTAAVIEILADLYWDISTDGLASSVISTVNNGISIILDVMDKQEDIPTLEKVIDNLIGWSGTIITKEPSNAKQLNNIIIKLAEKSIQMAGNKLWNQNYFKETVTGIDIVIDKERLVNAAEKILKRAESLEKNLIENNIFSKRLLNKTMEIIIPAKDKKKVGVTLSGDIINAVFNKGINNILIQTPMTSFFIRPHTFADSISGKSIYLSSEQVNYNELSDFVHKQIPTDSVVINLEAYVSGEAVTQFAKPIEVIFPYEGEAENTDEITVFLLNDDGSIEPIGGLYDTITQTVRFTTTHFSKYFAKPSIKQFNDLSNYSWARKSIEIMAGKGFVNGKRKGEFAPDDAITRAEFVAMIARILKYEAGKNTALSFEDVTADAWYYNAVEAAYYNGWISGRTQNFFAPDASITRQEICKVVENILLKKGFVKGNGQLLTGYSDEHLIAEWAKDAVAFCTELEIVNGMNEGRFEPNEKASRAQAAVIAYRLFNLLMN